MLAAPVCAQSQPANSAQAGLRRLDWSGKAEPRPADTQARTDASTRSETSSRPATPNRYSARVAPPEPSRVWNPFPADPAPPVLRPAIAVQAPAPGVQTAPTASRPAALRVTAAPQSAVRPPAPPPGPSRTAQPAPAPAQANAVQPGLVARPPVAAPVQSSVRDTPAEAPPRSYADFSRPVGSPPAASPAPAVAAVSSAGGDLSPPRSYADFSRPMTAPAGSAASPPRGEAPRYYSVHREYGRQPEQPEIPEAFFIDSVGGEDLAAPPPPPMSERDERRARAAAADPDAPQS